MYVALFVLQLVLVVLFVLSFIKAGVGATFVQGALNSTASLVSNVNTDFELTKTSQFLAADEAYAQYYLWAGWILVILFLLLEILLCVARKYIKITIALVSEATQAMRNSKFMVFLPVVISGVQLLVLAFTCLVLLHVSVLGAGTSYDIEKGELEAEYSGAASSVDQYFASLGAPAGLVTNISSVIDLSATSKSDEQECVHCYQVASGVCKID